MAVSEREIVLPERDSGALQSHFAFKNLITVGGFYYEEFFTQAG